MDYAIGEVIITPLEVYSIVNKNICNCIKFWKTAVAEYIEWHLILEQMIVVMQGQ